MQKYELLRYTVLLIFSVLVPLTPFAQSADFNVQLLDERNGIRTSNIRRVIRDKQGFLWVLSPRYLQRFDGQEVTRIDVEGEDMLDIVVDHSGDVWVSTQSGVRIFVNDAEGFRDVPVEVGPAVKLNFLQVSSDNSVWVISGIGLYKLDRAARSFKLHPLPGLLNQRYYRRLFEQFGPELFLGDTHTIFSYNPANGKVRQIPFDGASGIVPVSENVVWVTNGRKQVFELDFATGQTRPISVKSFGSGVNSPFLEIISYLALDSSSALVSTNHGCFLYHLQRKTFEKVTTYYYGTEFPVDELSASYYDGKGTLWLVYQGGILFLRPLEHSFHWRKDFTTDDKGGHNIVYAITGDAGRSLWMGTAAGLIRFDPASRKSEIVYPSQNNAGDDVNHSVRGLVYDDGYLIFGAYSGGIQLYHTAKKTFREPRYPPGSAGEQLRNQIRNDHVYHIRKLRDGSYLVLGDLRCYRLSATTYELEALKFSGADYILQSAAQTSSGYLWLSGYRGMIYLDPQFKTIHQDTLFLPNRLVSAMLLQNDTTVWAGGVGLHEVTLKTTGLARRQIIPELANQQILLLFKDDTGKIWIGAEKGLYRYTPFSEKLEWFDIWDNLQNKQFNPGSFYRAPDRQLYLGGSSGLNYFLPDSINPAEETLNVLITGVKINQNDSLVTAGSYREDNPQSFLFDQKKAAGRGEILRLPWDKNSIEIQFATPYFRNPKKLRYRYRMTGLDSSWVMNGANNTVRFSSLPPGSYSFLVATSPDGVAWYETASAFQFRIYPPFWKTWWFILLTVLFVAGAAYLVIKQRLRRIRLQESRVYALQNRANSLEKEKALAMYEGLKQQLNPHFLFNSLTSLSSLIRIDQRLAGEFLDGLSKTYRYILKNRDNELVPLTSEIRFARTFVQLQKTRFEEGLSVVFYLDEDKCGERLLIAPVTLQNLIENAIKHNIVSPDSPLVIEIGIADGYLVVRNNSQKKRFVETSNRQGLANLKSLYRYLSEKPLYITDEADFFTVRIPLISS